MAALRRVGLEELTTRLDEAGKWGQTLTAAVQRSSVTGAVTGFELQGFAEDAVTLSVVEGPALDACPGGEDAAWSRVPRSTQRARTHEGPVLEVVHEGVAHRVPTTREAAA